MKTACQITMVAMLVLSLLVNLYWDIEGKAARKPRGFGGVVETLVIVTVFVAIYWKAGAFSNLVGEP